MRKLITLMSLAAFLAMPVVAQHGRGSNGGNRGGGGRGGRPEQHQGPRARGEDRGRGRDGRPVHVDDQYRHDHFGRDHYVVCSDIVFVDGQFFFGGVYFNLDVWPAWGADDVVYIDYVDGDYFLVDFTLNARVAIVLVG